MTSIGSAAESLHVSYGELDEPTLVTYAQKGDMDAFGELYSRVFPQLCRRLQRSGANRDQAEDLAATTLMRAITKIETLTNLETAECFSRWTYTIAHNALKDAFRRSQRKREMSLEALLEASFEEPSSVESNASISPTCRVEDELVLSRLALMLKGVMRTLTDQQRQIIVLRYTHQLPQREVAEQLGITVGAVKTCTYRLMERIKRDSEIGQLYRDLYS